MDEAGHKTGPAACFVPAESKRHAGRAVGRSQAGHKTGPAACFVPAESKRHAGRAVGRSQAGHRTSPAACCVPAESEPHAGGEVGEGGVSRRMRRAARIQASCDRRKSLWDRARGGAKPAWTQNKPCGLWRFNTLDAGKLIHEQTKQGSVL